MNSLYGNYRTRKFTDIFPNADEFLAKYRNCGIITPIQEATLTNLYYLLYARYGNSHITNSDENQFIYKVFALIFQYGPTWEKRLGIQQSLRNLSEAELLTGAKQINNHSYNPSTAPSTATTEEFTTTDEQTSTHYKKSKLEAYALLNSLLETDVTGEFLDRFKSLFLTIVEPQLPLWYITDIEGE